MKAMDLWWSRELLRIEDISASTLHLLDDNSIQRIFDAAERIQWHCRDEMMSRGEWF